MGWLRNLFLNSVSASAVAAFDLAEREARLGGLGIYGQRPTPRKPERRKAFPVASPKRAKHRREMRAIYERNLRREHEIGVAPKYRNRRSENDTPVRLAWALRAREWNRANPVMVDG